MEANYYNGDDNKVIELHQKDFSNKRVINEKFTNKYGLIKAYAPW